MSATIVPTIDAATADEYRAQIERVATFATRLHIDVADGQMTPTPLVPITEVWWPGGVRADIHVMYKRPVEHLEALIALGPQLVILHAEAEGSFAQASQILRQHGIEAGVALLQDTPVSLIENGLDWVDHVLVYSGSLGTFGGKADMALLEKVRQIQELKPQIEIGWDGGVSADNALALAEAGVEVLNAGGFIHKSSDPRTAYATLESEIRKLYA